MTGERRAPGGAGRGEVAVDPAPSPRGDGQPVAADGAEEPDGDRSGVRQLLEPGARLGGGGDDDTRRGLAEQELVETSRRFQLESRAERGGGCGDAAFEEGEGETSVGAVV